MFLCTGETVVNANAYEGEFHALRCKRWSCPHCREINRRKVMMAAKHGNPNIFLTLTCKPDLHETPDAAARDMVRGLVALRKRLARRFNIDRLPFIVVFERTKKGWPHMHLLIRSKFIPWQVLRAMWREITGAFEVDVRHIAKRAQVMFYVTKYIGKDLAAFEGCKRWWRSHNYNEVDDEWQSPALYGTTFRRAQVTLPRLRTALAILNCHVEQLREDKLYFRWRDLDQAPKHNIVELARSLRATEGARYRARS